VPTTRSLRTTCCPTCGCNPTGRSAKPEPRNISSTITVTGHMKYCVFKQIAARRYEASTSPTISSLTSIFNIADCCGSNRAGRLLRPSSARLRKASPLGRAGRLVGNGECLQRGAPGSRRALPAAGSPLAPLLVSHLGNQRGQGPRASIRGRSQPKPRGNYYESLNKPGRGHAEAQRRAEPGYR
jgi:hypothetical protein